jgi:predicted RNA-binding Zn ribbon-like protein
MTAAQREIPSTLAPVLAFINTIDVEEDTDELAGRASVLAHWLTKRRLVPAAVTARPGDVLLALDLRAGLRALALVNNGGRSDSAAIARGALAFNQLPLIATIAPLQPTAGGLTPYESRPVRAALAVIVAGYTVGVATGEWKRIRVCPDESCAWAFWDATPKAARRWCTMRVCGNRAKVRAFAQRQSAQRAADRRRS